MHSWLGAAGDVGCTEEMGWSSAPAEADDTRVDIGLVETISPRLLLSLAIEPTETCQAQADDHLHHEPFAIQHLPGVSALGAAPLAQRLCDS